MSGLLIISAQTLKNFGASKMKTHLLKKTVIAATLITLMSACTQDEGTDANFGTESKVKFTSDSLTVSLNEKTGIQVVDLLADAEIDGVPLSEITTRIFIQDMVMSSPDETVPARFYVNEEESVGQVNQRISPFKLSADLRSLEVNTDTFDYADPAVQNNAWRSSLHFCDNTDLNSGFTTGSNPVIILGPDGVIDNPAAVTYTIEYIVDTGYKLAVGEEPARRTLSLTINASEDDVTDVVAADIELPAGGTAQLLAETAPAYACGDLSLTYSIADSAIATINATTGEVTGVGQGTTEATITHAGTGISTTAMVTVTSGFTLAITNQPKDGFGSPTGQKEVPACTTTGIIVEPANATGDLTGVYTYDWMSSDAAVGFSAESAYGFGATGLFTTGTANPTDLANLPMATVTVGYLTGDTGNNNASDTADKTIDVTVTPNLACDSRTTYTFDSKFTDYNIGGANSFKEINGGLGTMTKSTAGLTGDALSYVRNAVVVPDGGVSGYYYENWGLGAASSSFFGANFGLIPGSHFKTLKVAMWAKVIKADPTNTDDVKITHTLLPWLSTPGGNRPPKRALSPEFIGVIPATANGEWVYIEFVDQFWDNNASSYSDTFEIPATWTHRDGPDKGNTSVIPEWYFEGLSNGDEILIDEYSIIQK